uniref:Uncharacterized protein n=1 Tax=Oryza glumipatula TaxID=40148 RepID=A0A0D9YE11_9ORYZ
MEKKATDDDDDAPNRPSYGTYSNDPVARRASQKTTDRDGVRDGNGSGTMHGAVLSDGEKVTTITMDLASFDAADGLDTWTRKRLSGTWFRPRLTSRCASRTHALLPAVVRQQRGGGGLLLRQSGVALAWGKSAGVLRAEEVGSGVHGSAVVQGRRGVGLPEDLRAPAPHVKNGTAQVLAEMKLYRYVRTRSF